MTDIEKIKIEALENKYPYFTDDEIQYYYEKNDSNVYQTARELLLLKSQNTTLSVSGMNTADTSDYFYRMASRFNQATFIEVE